MPRNRRSLTSARTKMPARHRGPRRSSTSVRGCWKTFTSYPESARYYFALYNSKDLPNAQETAIAGLTSFLLTAPETPIRLGSGELSMYRDIATLDQGPGLSQRNSLADPEHDAACHPILGGGAARGAVLPPLARRRTAGAARYEVPERRSASRAACPVARVLCQLRGERRSHPGRARVSCEFSQCPGAHVGRSADGGRIRAQE